MKQSPSLWLGVVFSLSLFAHAAEVPKREKLIIRLDAKVSAEAAKVLLQRPEIEQVESLVPSLNLWAVTLKPAAGVRALRNTFSRSPLVKYAQPDHKVKLRQLPNDPKFKDLWSLNGLLPTGDIGATKTWDLGTGGKDARGRDVVVAVVDGGMDITHPDLKKNIWTNAKEIEGNGIDDDANGYIDDIHGWNAFNDSGELPTDPTENYHGTHVAGIVGAEGNNDLHVTGLNWQVKVLPVAGASGETSTVAKAYNYVLTQKKLWLETHGEKGANIVVTNSSFGVDGADCSTEEFSVWNDLYNAMGEVGILSATATANASIDVEEVGDVPTGCSSPYLVTVTNTTREDEKNSDAGYSAKHIHLGAPGTEILSTIPNGGTRRATGTSMATPHVSGAIGLLHSLGSQKFAEAYESHPAETAKKLKEILLRNVDPIPALKGITTSEGRLNVYKAALEVSKY